MIKNFDEIKKQLTELSSVINNFKSESVQLRIVDLIFKGREEEADLSDQEETADPLKNSIKPKAKKKTKAAKNGGKSPVRKGGSTPSAILDQLLEKSFFKKGQTIGQIIDHCSVQLARTFKPNELSTPLARFTRSGKLNRSKNGEGQYEYKQS